MLRQAVHILSLLAGFVALGALNRPAVAFTPAEAKAPMTVTLVRSDARDCGADCPEWLALTGRIGFDTPPRLAAALAKLGPRRVPVLLDSPGGESLAGTAMGRMIRAHGLDTAVATTTETPCAAGDPICQAYLRAGEHPGHVESSGGWIPPACASACVLVLAGGVDRVVPPGAFVGVHQAKQVLTYHPVMNRFRILSRTVNGRKVEISRTLVSSQALPVKIVTGAAPNSLYTALDRHLLALGVDESIMPLMRATPSSGIHWLTQSELGTTRIATDATPVATLVLREAGALAIAADKRREVHLPAALTLRDGRRWGGSAVWRIDATTPGIPALVIDWNIPERHLRGSVEIVATDAPGAATSFKVRTRFAPAPGPDPVTIVSILPPELCDEARCHVPVAGDTVFNRPAAAFDVQAPWRSFLLDDLRQDAWLRLFIGIGDGFGSVDLPLASPDANAITAWERLCCGVDATTEPLATPSTVLPRITDPPEHFRMAGIPPVQPAPVRGSPSPVTLDLPALFDAAPSRQHGFPATVHGSLTWFPLGAPATPGPNRTVLLGTADLPAPGLRVGLEVAGSEPGIVGRTTLRLHVLTEDTTRFGPLTGIFALNSYDADSHPQVLISSVTSDAHQVEHVIRLDVPTTGRLAGAIQVAFNDVAGRRLTLAFPLDPAIAAVLQAVSRLGDAPPS